VSAANPPPATAALSVHSARDVLATPAADPAATWTASTFLDEYERKVLSSLDAFSSSRSTPAQTPNRRGRVGAAAHDGTPIFRRRPIPRGPLVVFGYDYFADHAKAAGLTTPPLLSYEGSWGSGEEYAFEALNFADGTRSARQITAALTTEYGPVPEELVIEYLRALKTIAVLE
jgi:hypothetical protein